MRTKGKIVAVILAAGFSSRMGKYKPLLPLGETTIIGNAIKNLHLAGIEDVRVITGHNAQILAPVVRELKATPVFNPDYAGEMYLSVAAGVKTFAGDVEAFLLLPCDMPMTRWHSIRAVVHKYRKTGATIVYPTFQGQRGHPTLIAARCFPGILTLQGTNGLRGLLAQFAASAVEVEVPDQGVVMDMDTPGDYRAACEYFLGRDIPTEDEYTAILRKYQVPDNIVAHCRKVAGIAQQLTSMLSAAGCHLNSRLVAAGALLHDLAKTKPGHARRGARLLLTAGFPAVAQIVGVHMDLFFGANDPVDERAVVYLADKLVCKERMVSLDTRLATARQKFANNSGALTAATRRMETAIMIQNRVTSLLGVRDLVEALERD